MYQSGSGRLFSNRRADDGSWSAYTLTPSLVVGRGKSRDAALDDLRMARIFWLGYMKNIGQVVPAVSTELVSFEVAA